MKYDNLILKKEEETKGVVVVPENQLIPVEAKGNLISVRTMGEFAYRGFYLDDGYDWVAGVDSLGFHVLLPLKKE